MNKTVIKCIYTTVSSLLSVLSNALVTNHMQPFKFKIPFFSL